MYPLTHIALSFTGIDSMTSHQFSFIMYRLQTCQIYFSVEEGAGIDTGTQGAGGSKPSHTGEFTTEFLNFQVTELFFFLVNH